MVNRFGEGLSVTSPTLIVRRFSSRLGQVRNGSRCKATEAQWCGRRRGRCGRWRGRDGRIAPGALLFTCGWVSGNCSRMPKFVGGAADAEVPEFRVRLASYPQFSCFLWIALSFFVGEVGWADAALQVRPRRGVVAESIHIHSFSGFCRSTLGPFICRRQPPSTHPRPYQQILWSSVDLHFVRVSVEDSPPPPTRG